MTPNEDPIEPVNPPVEDPAAGTGAPDESMEPPGWTLTEKDIAEIKASGLTLSDVIRELGLDEEE